MILNGSFHGRPSGSCGSLWTIRQEVEALKDLEERSVMEAKGLWQEHRNNKDRSLSRLIELAELAVTGRFFWGDRMVYCQRTYQYVWTWSLDRATSCHIIGFSWDVIIDVISRYCAISFANDGTTRWHHDLWSCPSQSDNVVTVFSKVWWRKATSWARCGRFGMSRTWMNHAETMAKLPTGISLRSIKTMMIMLGITTALRHHCT